MTIKDISRWESCRLEDRKEELPRNSGVYAVTAKNRVFYIGRSVDINRRWRTGHHRYEQATKLKNPRIAWIVLGRHEINRVERVCIQQYRPAWNGTRIEKVPVWFVTGLKGRLIALGIAAIAGICVGLLSLYLEAPSPSSPETQVDKVGSP